MTRGWVHIHQNKNRKSNSNTAAVRFPKLELAAIYVGALIGGYMIWFAVNRRYGIWYRISKICAWAHLFALVVLHENADGDQRVRHQSSDRHHLHERVEIEQQSRQRHQKSADPRRQQRRIGPAIHGAEKSEHKSVLRHRVETARQRKDWSHDGCHQATQAANYYHVFSAGNSDLYRSDKYQ